MTKPRRREDPQIRKNEILDGAVRVATRYGYQTITREDVAAEAGTSCALVTRYFVTMEHLKNAVIDAAITREILPILAQAISMGDTRTKLISPELKQKIISFFD